MPQTNLKTFFLIFSLKNISVLVVFNLILFFLTNTFIYDLIKKVNYQKVLFIEMRAVIGMTTNLPKKTSVVRGEQFYDYLYDLFLTEEGEKKCQTQKYKMDSSFFFKDLRSKVGQFVPYDRFSISLIMQDQVALEKCTNFVKTEIVKYYDSEKEIFMRYQQSYVDFLEEYNRNYSNAADTGSLDKIYFENKVFNSDLDMFFSEQNTSRGTPVKTMFVIFLNVIMSFILIFSFILYTYKEIMWNEFKIMMK